MRILVTGAAGFIGMHVAQSLLARGDEVAGLDNLNDYYDVSLKQARLDRLKPQRGFSFVRADIGDRPALAEVFAKYRPQRVIHLAAQVGVRCSLKNPAAYIQSNVVGFGHVLEECREHAVEHLVYASSSSVYGGHAHFPSSESDSVDHPVSLYAATKKANELMAHTYSHLYGLPTTGLRFFTVYGPWGRPDMAPFLFAAAMRDGRPIDVFNHGDMLRDFTYVDDATESVVRVCDKPPTRAAGGPPCQIFNVGNGEPVSLGDFITALETSLGHKAQANYLPMQPGDVRVTAANCDALQAWTGFRPRTSLSDGVDRFAQWYLGHYAKRH